MNPMCSPCSHCGHLNVPGASHCIACGARLQPGGNAHPVAAAIVDPSANGLVFPSIANPAQPNPDSDPAPNSQRRRITVLFTDLSGYSEASSQLEDEDVYELIQQYVRLLVKEVHKYEGTISKLTGDGLMALFGAPVAHENDAERALRAALDMQKNIYQWSKQVKDHLGVLLNMRIGVHTGLVIVGEIGSQVPMDYTAIGDTVNLAHRLEEAAPPGAILTSAEVFQETRGVFDFEAMPDIRLRGSPRSLALYRVVGLRERPKKRRNPTGIHAPLIGRDAELGQLRGWVNRLAVEKRGGFILISGEAGIGKSRLAAELMAELDGERVTCLEGHTLTYRRTVSYWLFQDLLRDALNVTPETPESETRQKLQAACDRLLGEGAAERLPYLETLLSLPISSPEAAGRLAHMEAGSLRAGLLSSVQEFLLQVARRRPLLLVLEDLHWADEASLDLLHTLLEGIAQAPVLILAVCRPIQNGRLGSLVEWASTALDQRFRRIELQPLPLAKSRDLLAYLTAGIKIPTGLAQQILDRSGGIPLYLEEMLHTILDERGSSHAGAAQDSASGVDLGALAVPASLQGLILARFDQLSAEQRRLLQVASTIGQHFTLELLRRLLGSEDPTSLRQALDELVGREFLLPTSKSPHGEYGFRHVLMSEVIYSTMLKRERSHLHGQIGDALEALHADRLNEHIELLTRHYSWSAKLDKAFHYLILAGQKAASRFINEQARKYFREALALMPIVEHTPQQALQVYAGLGDLALLAQDYPTAAGYFRSALEVLPPEAPDAEETSRVLQGKLDTATLSGGESGRQPGGPQPAAQDGMKAGLVPEGDRESEPGAAPPASNAARLQALSGMAARCEQAGDLDAAITLWTEALALVDSAAHPCQSAHIFARLGRLYLARGAPAKGGALLRKSLAGYVESADSQAAAEIHNLLGEWAWQRGDWPAGMAHLNASLQLTQPEEASDVRLDSLMLLGACRLEQGDLAGAEQAFEEALALAKKLGLREGTSLSLLGFARLKLARGDGHQACKLGERLFEVFRGLGHTSGQVEACLLNVSARLGFAEAEEALHWARTAGELFKGKSEPSQVTSPTYGRWLRLMGEVCAARGELAQAERWLNESAVVLESVDCPLEQGRTALAQARLAFEQGMGEAGRTFAQQANLVFHQLGAGLDAAALAETLKRRPAE